MTAEQIKAVKQSWKIFRSIDPVLVGDAFYSKLFSDHQPLRKMFPNDMQAQYRKLIEMISAIVSRLDQMESITADIEAMAIRHVQYGVKEEQYALVGESLLWTLSRGLGSQWNDALQEAWTSCYTELADVMISASRAHSPTAKP